MALCQASLPMESSMPSISHISSPVEAPLVLDSILIKPSYQGYNPNFQYQKPIPSVAGWSIPQDQSTGFVATSAYGSPDIICHVGATPGASSAKVTAGTNVTLQWTTWPDSHHGPVIDYLAPCNGPCSGVDKTTLSFVKIAASGLLDGSSAPGKWAADELLANNISWTTTIPKDIAPGEYVLRHEVIALHEAGQVGGAQNYPQCVNLVVSGDGTATPTGVKGTELYKPTDAGIVVNIYQKLGDNYTIPGPPLYVSA